MVPNTLCFFFLIQLITKNRPGLPSRLTGKKMGELKKTHNGEQGGDTTAYLSTAEMIVGAVCRLSILLTHAPAEELCQILFEGWSSSDAYGMTPLRRYIQLVSGKLGLGYFTGEKDLAVPSVKANAKARVFRCSNDHDELYYLMQMYYFPQGATAYTSETFPAVSLLVHEHA